MQVVKPVEFAQSFDKAVKKRAKDVAKYWRPWKAKEYTALFVSYEKSILRGVANELGLKYNCPWWTLDAILYEEADYEAFPKDWEMAKYLSVAIEHENSSRRAPYQINKLSIFNAPLKVLITYPGRPGRRAEDKHAQLLTKCLGVVERADTLDDFSHTRKQMVILGSDQEQDPSLAWRYFVYEHHAFREIKP